MDNTLRNRWQIRLVAIIIFALGFAAGLLALNGYRAWAARSRSQADRFEKRLQQVLTPDQWQRFQQMRDEMRARRGRGGAR